MPLGLVYAGQTEIIGGLIGRGQSGRVHRGLVMGKPAAVKVYTAAEELHAFDKDARVANETAHANLLGMLSIWPEQPDTMCMATELCDCSLEMLLYPSEVMALPCTQLDVALLGASLPGPHRVPRWEGRLPLSFTVSVGVQMAQALAYLHPNIVHGNLKPSSILLQVQPHEALYSEPSMSTESMTRAIHERLSTDHKQGAQAASRINVNKLAILAGVPMMVKLSDFAAARFIGSEPTGRGVLGCLPYMAPEVILGGDMAAGSKSDVYSFGVLMWELIHRQRPWQGLDAEKMVQQKLDSKRPLSWDLPKRRYSHMLQELLERCVAQEPDRRPPASVLVVQLAMCLMDELGAERSRAAQALLQEAAQAARKDAMQGLPGIGVPLNAYGIPDLPEAQSSLLAVVGSTAYEAAAPTTGQGTGSQQMHARMPHHHARSAPDFGA